MINQWVVRELGRADFHDPRLSQRLIHIVSDLIASPMSSVPQACGSRAATKATYRFWDSSSVTPEAIFAVHGDRTVERLHDQSPVLIVQDTTDLDFTTHRKTTGLGPLDNSHVRGLKVHSALALTSDGVPLGLLHQEVWARDEAKIGQAKQRRQRPTVDKESQRWLTAFTATEARLPLEVDSVTVADREGDIYDFLAITRRPNSHLLIRATHNRRVEASGAAEALYLWPAIRQSPAQGHLMVELRRQDGHAARRAELTVRFQTLTITPPRHHPARSTLQPISVQVILAEEEDPGPDNEPIKWLLVTTLPVESFAQARQCIAWYTERWLIERFHYVLKSGCQVEKLQLEEADRLERALATYCIVAWRLLWLTYQARRQPTASAAAVFEHHEWQSLYATIHKTVVVPAAPPTLRDTVRWLAQLGGFQGRKRDGEPGVKTIWIGLRRLNDIAQTWLLLRPPSPSLGTCG